MAIRLTQDNITPSIEAIQRNLADLPQRATDYWRSITPKRTGYARSHTRRSGDSIVADYNYAKQLDEGTSRQAPRGMSKPTEQYIAQTLKTIVRK